MGLKDSIAIMWFRRDLRLQDNVALYHALSENASVLPVFIFDEDILSKLENPADRRVDFIHQALQAMNYTLSKADSGLRVFHSSPFRAFQQLCEEYTVARVYTNHDYEPYGRTRDEQIKTFLKEKNIDLKTYKDQCVFEKNEVVKDDQKPYTVFTPYSVKWKKRLTAQDYKLFDTSYLSANYYRYAAKDLPSLKTLGFEKTDVSLQVPLLDDELLLKYKQQRDYPAIAGTSRLSMHLRFGTVSVRGLVSRGLAQSETWLNELIWRDFYMMIIWHFPHVVKGAFKPAYNQIAWRQDEQGFQKWCEGRTGFPIVDAGMRELNTTGFMHNRVRMIVSSFLVKDLLIDWRWGEAYFAQKLNDFDLSANNGGWQWAAGTGCDAAPYFRVFNPTEQQKKFDPDFAYIRKWIPEYGTPAYPAPMVDHAAARIRALAVYKEGLAKLDAALPA